MSFYQSEHKTMEFSLGCAILLAVSVSGIVEIFTSRSIEYISTSVYLVDFIVYAAMFVLTFFIYFGVPLFKSIYAIVAVVWYIVLIFVLPAMTGHHLNLIVVFMQIIATLLAYFMLYTKSK